jgi:hypothetical protein
MAALSTSAATMIAEIRCIKVPQRERTRANSYFVRCNVSKKNRTAALIRITRAQKWPRPAEPNAALALLIWIRAKPKSMRLAVQMDWQPIATAPFDRDLQLAVINYGGTHALGFPCRRILNGWLKSGTQERVNVRPTHWREWKNSVLFSTAPTLERGKKL